MRNLRKSAYTETEETITEQALHNSSAKLLPKGALSIALYGATIGKLGILGFSAATNQACANCHVDERFADNWFLFYYLLSQRNNLVDAGQGGAQPNLTNLIVREWNCPLPPRTEQGRIVEKLRSTLSTIRPALDRLDRAKKILKRFRQARLSGSVFGKVDGGLERKTGKLCVWELLPSRDTQPTTGGMGEASALPTCWTWQTITRRKLAQQVFRTHSTCGSIGRIARRVDVGLCGTVGICVEWKYTQRNREPSSPRRRNPMVQSRRHEQCCK